MFALTQGNFTLNNSGIGLGGMELPLTANQPVKQQSVKKPERNSFKVYEITNAIPQYGNSCWLSSCINMFAMIPEATTSNILINQLLNRIRGLNSIDHKTIVNNISKTLTAFNKEHHQFEVSDGIEIFNSIIKNSNTSIWLHEIPDLIDFTQFIIAPFGVMISMNFKVTDMIKFTNQLGDEYYQPVAWIYRTGNLNNGHCVLIYQTEFGILKQIDTITQTCIELDSFPEIDLINTIEYVLYSKL